jgi:Putative auto-transporter adhesin, head GIN domain
MNFLLRKISQALAVSALILTVSCSHGIRGNGNVINETRSIGSFNRIDADGAFALVLHQGNTESVKVEADENLQSYIIVRTEGNTLYLDMKKHSNFGDIKKMVIHVTFKELSAIRSNIVGALETPDTIRVNELQVKANSVGRTQLLISGNKLDANINSVGSSNFAGQVADASIINKGVGQLNARDLKAGNLVFDNSGVGSAQVYAEKTISINSSGVGSVTYYGPAQVTKLNSSGVGKVSSGN